MIIYALIVTFILGGLTAPIVIAYFALRADSIADAKRRHPSNQDAPGQSILDYTNPN